MTSMDGLIAKLDAQARLDEQALQRACMAAALLGMGQAQREIVNRPRPVKDQGQLAASYHVTPLANGARLENFAPHAAHQEYGTRPFWAPIGPLVDWARRKLRGKQLPPRAQGPRMALGPPAAPKMRIGTPHDAATVPHKRADREAAAQAMARGAQQSIARRGIIPKRFHAAASEHFPGFMRRALLAELRRLS